MNSNTKLLTALVLCFVMSIVACKSTTKVKDTADTKGGALSTFDLTELKDNHKLNPDDAIVSGLIKQLVEGGSREFTLEVIKMERQGFGFSNNLKSGDLLSVIIGKKGEELKSGQSVLLVISALRMPGSTNKFNLEKVLAVMPD